MTEKTEVDTEVDQDLEQLKKALNYYKNESLRFKDLIKEGKTSYKKKYYREKLKKNNELFAKLIYLYDKASVVEKPDNIVESIKVNK